MEHNRFVVKYDDETAKYSIAAVCTQTDVMKPHIGKKYSPKAIGEVITRNAGLPVHVLKNDYGNLAVLIYDADTFTIDSGMSQFGRSMLEERIEKEKFKVLNRDTLAKRYFRPKKKAV